jgi:hypothetical protein
VATSQPLWNQLKSIDKFDGKAILSSFFAHDYFDIS